MKTSILLRLCLAVLFFALASSSANAQNTPDLLEGLTPYQSFHGGDFDSINLSNGNVLLRIPLIDYPQRGGLLKLGFTFVDNSKVAAAAEVCFGSSGCEYLWYGYTTPVTYNQVVDNQLAGVAQSFYYLPHNLTEFAAYAIGTSDGALHPLLGAENETGDATGFYTNPSGTNDLTGPTFVIDRDGIRYGLVPVNGVSTREDPNGNQIIFNGSYQDTIGRVVPFGSTSTSSSACPSGGSLQPVSAAYLWTVPGPNAGTESFTFCDVSITVSIPANEPSPIKGTTIAKTLTQSIVLPNGTAWSFEYNDRNPGDPSTVNFGIPTTVILPTGGTIAYTYETIGPISAAETWSRWVSSRTVNANDGTGPHTWTYSYVPGGSAPTTTVTDPLGNNTVHTFGLFSNDYYETETQYYQLVSGTQTLLKTVATNYTSLNNGNIEYQIAGVVPKSVTTTWPNNQVSQTQTDYDSQGSGTWSYGNVIAKREYDYGTGAPGTLLRTTTTQYEAFVNSTYLTNNLLTLPSSVQITDGGGTQRAYTTYGYDENALEISGMGASQQHDLNPADGKQRGNQTSVHHWLNTTGAYLVSTAQYFDTGTAQTATDPKGNSTTYAYSATYECGYPTTVTNALSQSTTYAYDSNIGLVESVTDPNNQTTRFTYDSMWRVATVSYPDNGYASVTHQETTFPFSATLTKKITSTPLLNYVMTNIFDGVGRFSQSQLTSDPLGTDYTVTTYDADGRKASETNPYRTTSDPTYGTTTYHYDALNRSLLITEPDGSNVSTSYTGNSTTVTDEAGRNRESFADGLDRMTEVIENPGGLGYVTNYSYDTLNDLVGVVQNASHTRSFVYDSLARLTSATNPETGTISYTYDADGNVQTRKDARSIITTYTVDALNRVTLKTYSDGVTPTAQFLYDTASVLGVTLANPIGRLSQSYTSVVESLFSYDPLGRVVAYLQSTPQHNSAAFLTEYTYDLAGDVTSFSNGLGVTFSYTIDGARRTTLMTSSWSDANHPATLATVNSSVGFWPTGAIREVTLGNGLTETSAYNNRLQPCRLNLNSSSTALGTCTDAIPSGNVQDFNYGFNFGTTDNSDVVGWTATGQQSFNRSYSYDPLNRLSSMSDSATNQACKGLSWVYDAWGNRTAQNVTSGSCLAPQTPVNANNQLIVSGDTYDAAGNLTNDASHSYTYDAENRLTKVDGGSTAIYSYDAIGHRVEKPYPGGGYQDYIYDLAGNVAGDWQATSAYTGPEAEYAYLNGELIAEYFVGTTYFIHKDHLGSTRLVTGVTQSLIDNMDYLPFGEQIAGDTSITHKFTGKERDSESGLDNFEARYDASSMGRFMTPDPMGGHLENPQSLNKYAYVLNNPTSLTDPTGLDSYLSCTQTKDNASTCQSQTVGYDANGKAQTATVQGVTNADKSFTATQIGNDANGNLVDKTTGTGSYTASANGSGVQFSNNGGQTSSSGVFVNGTPQNTFQDAGFANGGALSGFTFTLTNSKLEAGQTEAGSFTFAGTPDQAGAALQKAGFNPRSGENVGMNEYRSPGSFWTGANSSHFNVFQIGLKPWLSVPQAQGDMHFGEHNPYSPFGWVPHSSEANQ